MKQYMYFNLNGDNEGEYTIECFSKLLKIDKNGVSDFFVYYCMFWDCNILAGKKRQQ